MDVRAKRNFYTGDASTQGNSSSLDWCRLFFLALAHKIRFAGDGGTVGITVISGRNSFALGTAFRIRGLAGVAVRAVSRLGSLADFAYRTLVAFQQPRLVAKLAGQARQTRRLALRVLVEAFRTIVARRGIIIISCSVLAFVAILAILPLHVAVSARAARRALGAAFRIRRPAGFAVSAQSGGLGLADFADSALVALQHARRVAKLSGQARQAGRGAGRVLIRAFAAIATRVGHCV